MTASTPLTETLSLLFEEGVLCIPGEDCNVDLHEDDESDIVIIRSVN